MYAHGSEKQLFKAKKLRNTKNVPFTVATDHQLWMCYQQHDGAGNLNSRYLQSPLLHSSGHTVSVEHYAYSSFLPVNLLPADAAKLTVVSEVTVYAVRYCTNDIVMSQDKCCAPEAEFSIVKEIVVWIDDAYLICNCSTVKYFDSHKNAYCIKQEPEITVVNPSSLLIPWPAFWVAGEDCGEFFVSSFSCSDIDVIV